MVKQTIPVDIITLERLKDLISEGGAGFQFDSSYSKPERLTRRERYDRLKQALLLIEKLIDDLNFFEQWNKKEKKQCE